MSMEFNIVYKFSKITRPFPSREGALLYWTRTKKGVQVYLKSKANVETYFFGFVKILMKRALFSLLDEADYNIDELLVKLSDKVDWWKSYLSRTVE